MVKKSGSTKLKRQMAPKFWDIKRKDFQFILSAKPGPYSKNKCYPLGVLIRDVLHLCQNLREAKQILNSGQIKVDGKIRRDMHFGVGIMDIIEITKTGDAFRLMPQGNKLLSPVKTKEKEIKLSQIKNKVTITGGRIQYGFHDGKSLISDNKEMNVGDVCLIKIPECVIQNHIKFDIGCTALVIQGENAGKTGKVEEIKNGMFSLPKRVVLTFNDKTVELPIRIVMPIGVESPLLEVFSK